MILKLLETEDFPLVYKIMEQSFLKNEIRTYDSAINLLENDKYKIFVVKEKDGQVDAFITAWEFKFFMFVEHFAVKESLQGQKLGTKMMQEYLKQQTKPVILEAESIDTKKAKRRIEFYKRLGFVLNDFGYLQPPLQKSLVNIPLKIMSYPIGFSEEDFIDMKKEIFTNAYGIKI